VTVVDASPIPVLVNYTPSASPATLRPEDLASLATHDNLLGVVEGAGDLANLAELVALVSPKPVLVSKAPLLLAGLSVGAGGVIGPAGGYAPELPIGVIEAWRAGDIDVARAAQQKLAKLAIVLHATRAPVSSNVKVLLAATGLIAEASSPAPFDDLDSSERAMLLATAEKAGVLTRGTRPLGATSRDVFQDRRHAG
jgi:4-hydroxy-tetrahydrodipicolinate synthase